MPIPKPYTMTKKWVAPWTDKQIELLDRVQNPHKGDLLLHPYTCANQWHKDQVELVPTKSGWICPDCPYTQNWAWGVPEVFFRGD